MFKLLLAATVAACPMVADGDYGIVFDQEEPRAIHQDDGPGPDLAWDQPFLNGQSTVDRAALLRALRDHGLAHVVYHEDI